jgi:group I intron endonuclease
VRTDFPTRRVWTLDEDVDDDEPNEDVYPKFRPRILVSLLKGIASAQASKRPTLVYVSHCTVNSKLYFGITTQKFDRRRLKHISKAAKGSPYRFHRALQKYGVGAFEWAIVAVVPTWDAACKMERELIEYWRTTDRGHGYNTLEGGSPGYLNVLTPEEVRSKISGTLKAWHASDDPNAKALREKVSQVRRNFATSDETREKMRMNRLGRVYSDESRAKISEKKLQYPADVMVNAMAYAEQFGFRAAERELGIPRQTIRRWSLLGTEHDSERKRKMREHAHELTVDRPLVPGVTRRGRITNTSLVPTSHVQTASSHTEPNSDHTQNSR